jgi:hypothetical protein
MISNAHHFQKRLLMPNPILRATALLSRSVLRLISISMAFVVTLFLFATGQVVQSSGTPAVKADRGVLSTPVPLYGIIAPDYGIIPLYGPPAVQFQIKGTIRAKGGAPIESIKMILTDSTSKVKIDSSVTAADGSYSMDFFRVATSATWILSAKDVDGAAHGKYADKDSLIKVPVVSTGGIVLTTTIDLYLSELASALLPSAARTGAGTLDLAIVNAVNGSIEVRYRLPAQGRAWLALYGADGRRVRELFDESKSAGDHAVSIPLAGLAHGTYFLKLYAGGRVAIAKVVFAR